MRYLLTWSLNLLCFQSKEGISFDTTEETNYKIQLMRQFASVSICWLLCPLRTFEIRIETDMKCWDWYQNFIRQIWRFLWLESQIDIQLYIHCYVKMEQYFDIQVDIQLYIHCCVKMEQYFDIAICNHFDATSLKFHQVY